MALAESIASGQVNRSAADIYDTFFVPALFQQWTAAVAEAARVIPGQTVLDVACGSGVLARELAIRVGPTGAVTGIDINEDMLDVARRQNAAIHWQQGAAEELPFADNHFDAVVSQFGLMFFADRRQAITEMVRVLKPGRHLAVAVWDSLDNTPGYAAASLLLERLFGADIAQSLRSPYILGDTGILRGLFEDCGLSELSIETIKGVARFTSIEDWMNTDIRGWTLADALDDDQYALLLDEASVSLQEFARADGSIEFASPAHIVTVTKS